MCPAFLASATSFPGLIRLCVRSGSDAFLSRSARPGQDADRRVTAAKPPGLPKAALCPAGTLEMQPCLCQASLRPSHAVTDCPACRRTAMPVPGCFSFIGSADSNGLSNSRLRQMTSGGNGKSFFRFPSTSGNLHVPVLFHQIMPPLLMYVRDGPENGGANSEKQIYLSILWGLTDFILLPPHFILSIYYFMLYKLFFAFSLLLCFLNIFFRLP